LYFVLVVSNLFWLALLVQGIEQAKRLAFLPEDQDPVSTPKISILVPARNESRILSQTLESILNLDYPDFEVLVIDDHSEDNTFAIASDFAARDSRVRVMMSAELPSDWRGKSWALHHAALLAQGSWLLFTDADVSHHPKTLRCALALAQREKVDLLSVIPHMECPRFWDRIMLPSFAAILNIVRPLHKSNDPNSPVALAPGGFLLVKAMIFKYLGGYEQIHRALAEDVKLAELFKRSGYRIRTVLCRSKWVRTRMYDSFRGIWEGLSRHAFEGAGFNPVRIIAAAIAGNLCIVVPWLTAATGLIQHHWTLLTLSAFPVLLMLAMQTFLNRKWEIPIYYFFSFPLATLLYSFIMMDSMWSHYFRGGVVWKGRRYGH